MTSPAAYLRLQVRAIEQAAGDLDRETEAIWQIIRLLVERMKEIGREQDRLREDARDTRELARVAAAADRVGERRPHL